jgi:hypothetical protein
MFNPITLTNRFIAASAVVALTVCFTSCSTKSQLVRSNGAQLKAQVIDGLDESAEKCVGGLLTVKPFYGWGWSETLIESGQKKETVIEVPAPFQVRVTRVWHFQNVRRGFVGQVEERDSPFNGRWVVLSTRHGGPYRIAEPGDYNISLEVSEPSENQDGWPMPKDIRNRNVASGFAEVVSKL